MKFYSVTPASEVIFCLCLSVCLLAGVLRFGTKTTDDILEANWITCITQVRIALVTTRNPNMENR